MLLVDSHCHLNFPDFRDDLASVLANAKVAGVGIMQTICTDMEEFDEVYAIAQNYDHIYCSVGVHPNDTTNKEKAELETLLKKATLPKVIGIGETGLDYHYEHSDRIDQKESLLIHIEAARISGLPVIIHTREADEDTIAILQQEMQKGIFTGVIHCFTSSHNLAMRALEMGFYISLSGIITFKNAETIRNTVKDIPLERLLIETDAPFLAPLPHRGKRNEPAFVAQVNKKLSEIKGISEENCAEITANNFFTLFNKAQRP